MSVAEAIMLVLHPAVTLIFGILVLIFYIRVFVLYSHICLNRYDVLLVVVAIGGVVAFDAMLLLYTGVCGALEEPCTDLFLISAVSRVMRILALIAWFIIGHSAARRQRVAQQKHIEEALESYGASNEDTT